MAAGWARPFLFEKNAIFTIHRTIQNNTMAPTARLIGFFALSALLLTGACRRSTADPMRFVPADAGAVLVLAPGALFDKANWNEFRQDPALDLYGEDFGKFGLAFLRAPDSSGVDLSKPMYVSLRFSPNDVESSAYVLSLPLSDARRFADFLVRNGLPDAALETNIVLRLAEQTHYLRIEKDAAVYVWGQNIWKPWAEDLLAGRTESLAKNADFSSAAAAGHDAWLWGSADPVAGDRVLQTALTMVGLDSAILRGNHPVLYGDFLPGEIRLGMDFRFSEGLHRLFDPMFRDAQKTDFSALVPRERLSMLLSFAAEPTAIRDFLNKNAETTGLWASDLLAPLGVDATALLTALEGDMFVAAYEPGAAQTTDLLFGAACQDENATAVLLQNLGKNPQIRSVGKYWQHANGVFFGASKNLFFMSTRRERLEKALGGGYAPAEQLDASVWKACEGVAGLHLAPRSAAEWLLMAGDGFGDAAALDSLFDRFQGASGKVERRKLGFSLRFQDSGANGLFQLLSLLSSAYRISGTAGEVNLEDLMREEGTW